MPKAHTTNIPNIKVQDQIGTAISAIMYGAGGTDGAGGAGGAGGDGLQNNTSGQGVIRLNTVKLNLLHFNHQNTKICCLHFNFSFQFDSFRICLTLKITSN